MLIITETELLQALDNHRIFENLTPNFIFGPTTSEDLEVPPTICKGILILKEMVLAFPQHAEKIAAMVLKPVQFKRLTANGIDEVNAILDIFPNKSEQIAQIALSIEEFERFTSRLAPDFHHATPIEFGDIAIKKSLERKEDEQFNLKKLVDIFPHQRDTIVHIILNNATQFKRLTIDGLDDLCFLAKIVFPEYSDKFIAILLEDNSELNRFITSALYLQRFVRNFPEYRQEILQIILSPEYYLKFTRTSLDLIELLSTYPELANPIIEEALNDHEAFQQLISKGATTLQFVNRQASPRYVNQLAMKIFADEIAFNQLIAMDGSLSWITDLAKAFPKHHDQLAQTLLQNPVELRRITAVNASYQLKQLSVTFPKYANIFGQGEISVDDVLINWENTRTRLAAQALSVIGIHGKRKRQEDAAEEKQSEPARSMT